MSGYVDDDDRTTGQKETDMKSTLEWIEQHNRRVKLLKELEHADLPDCNCVNHKDSNEPRT